jgi:phage terminase small subunit
MAGLTPRQAAAPATRPLNVRQAKFAALYDGNGTETARRAGYAGSDNTLAQTARDLLSNPQVQAAIKSRQETELRPLIANRQKRQEFWTEVMQNGNLDLRDRLKASELLGRSEADFTEKMEHAGTGGAPLSFTIVRKVAR